MVPASILARAVSHARHFDIGDLLVLDYLVNGKPLGNGADGHNDAGELVPQMLCKPFVHTGQFLFLFAVCQDVYKRQGTSR